VYAIKYSFIIEPEEGGGNSGQVAAKQTLVIGASD